MRKRRKSRRVETNQFSIVANGEQFEAEGYAKRSRLQIARVWRRGERLPDSDARYELSGVEIELGFGPNLALEDQQAIAAAYIEAHVGALQRLRACAGVTSFYLGVQEDVDPKSLGTIMDLSATLMKLTLKVGLQVTVWACVRSSLPARRKSP